MKKVININFQGRVIPIEETAYEILQRYVDSLRKYFANEEGKDEIINDIEGRIAEIFSDNLKKGATCITDADVNAVMASIGRPEDFEKAEDSMNGGTRTQATQPSQPAYTYIQNWIPRLIFALPLIIGLVSGPFNIWLNHWEFWIGPKIVTGSLGFTLFVTYVILWIAVPVATTSSEKLEMRGEKVDLN